MDIGTAKPSKALLAEYPHRLIDIIDPSESYSAADFRADALAAMAEITARGNIPLLVGGTMLYYKALQEGLADMPPADAWCAPNLRKRLYALAGKPCTTSWRLWTRYLLHASTPMTHSASRGLWKSGVSAARP